MRLEGAIGTFKRSRPAWHVRTKVTDDLGRNTSRSTVQSRSHVTVPEDSEVKPWKFLVQATLSRILMSKGRGRTRSWKSGGDGSFPQMGMGLNTNEEGVGRKGAVKDIKGGKQASGLVSRRRWAGLFGGGSPPWRCLSWTSGRVTFHWVKNVMQRS